MSEIQRICAQCGKSSALETRYSFNPGYDKPARKQFASVLFYLKYRRSGGFWPFLDGIKRPSALSM